MVCVDAEINPWLARSPESQSVGFPRIGGSFELDASFGADFANGMTKKILPRLFRWRSEVIAGEISCMLNPVKTARNRDAHLPACRHLYISGLPNEVRLLLLDS